MTKVRLNDWFKDHPILAPLGSGLAMFCLVTLLLLVFQKSFAWSEPVGAAAGGAVLGWCNSMIQRGREARLRSQR